MCSATVQEAVVEAIEGNTLILPAAVMMVVAMLQPTGAFKYAAIRITKFAHGDTCLSLIYPNLAYESFFL